MLSRRSAMMCLCALLLFAACSQNPDEAKHQTAEEKTPKRVFLSIGTAPPGGTFFVVGGALAKVAQDHGGDLNWQVSAESTKGTQENIRRVVKGELDFAMANAAISYFAVRGQGAWQTPHEIRAVLTLAPNVATFIVAKQSAITNMVDLRGKRVVIGPAGAGFDYFVEPILKAHGVAWSAMTVLHNTQSGAVDMLKDGSASAAFLGGGQPSPAITQASASMDILLLPFQPAVREKLVADFPFFDLATIRGGTYRGVDEAYQGLNVGSMHLITSADKDEQVVYAFTKRLYEFRAEVVKAHPVGKAINSKNAARDTGIPFHPGAIRYYREIGIWSEVSD